MENKSGSWLEDAGVRWAIIMGGGCWIVSLGLLGINWGKLPPEMPWFYSQPWGEQQLIGKVWLLVVVLAFGGLLVINTVLAKLAGDNEQLLRRVLVWGGMVVELVLLMGLSRMMMVII